MNVLDSNFKLRNAEDKLGLFKYFRNHRYSNNRYIWNKLLESICI